MDEPDVRRVLAHPLCMIGSDGIPSPTGKPHPRLYGTFPRVLGTYCRDERLFPLEEAVRKMTSLPAQRMNLPDRGELREGYAADIVIFDPDTINDTATYEDPRQYPTGIEYVIVNGEVAAERGKQTPVRSWTLTAERKSLVAIEKLLPHVYRIGMGYVSAYLIATDDVTVIDTGLPKHRDAIFKAATEAGRKPEDVKHIALTHHHVDHTGSLAALVSATSATTYIHPLDAPIVRGEKAAPGPNKTKMAGRLLGPLMDRISPDLETVAARP